jgi:hypothetical protein
MWDGIDRRKFPRAQCRCVITIETKDASKTIPTITENIGAGGICAILNEDLGLFRGVNVELELDSGGSANLSCTGTVVWVVKKRDAKIKGTIQFDTGIEFVDIEDDEKERITKFVEKQLPGE